MNNEFIIKFQKNLSTLYTLLIIAPILNLLDVLVFGSYPQELFDIISKPLYVVISLLISVVLLVGRLIFQKNKKIGLQILLLILGFYLIWEMTNLFIAYSIDISPLIVRNILGITINIALLIFIFLSLKELEFSKKITSEHE